LSRHFRGDRFSLGDGMRSKSTLHSPTECDTRKLVAILTRK
jgi:hypothetical protein